MGLFRHIGLKQQNPTGWEVTRWGDVSYTQAIEYELMRWKNKRSCYGQWPKNEEKEE